MSTVTDTIATNGFLRRPETVAFAQVITPAEAAHMIATMKYENQRPLRNSKVQDYADEMDKGTFRELTQLFVADYHGKYVVLDGQHRLHAVVCADKPYLFDVVQKEVDSEEEMAHIYSTTDQGLRRSAGDIYGAYALAQEFGIGKTILAAFGAGVKFMINGCNQTSTSIRSDVVIPRMRLYAPYLQEYQAILIESSPAQGLYAQCKRSSTIAAALLSLRFGAPKAAERGLSSIVRDFWIGTLRDDGLHQGDPRKAANQHLMMSRTTTSRATRQNLIVSQSYSVRYLGSCINSYIKGESLKYAKVPDEKAPLNFYGVPSDPELWW